MWENYGVGNRKRWRNRRSAGEAGEVRGKAGDGRDAKGTYGGGALETDKATNTRTRALRGARKLPKSDTTPGVLTRHGTRFPVTVLGIHQ